MSRGRLTLLLTIGAAAPAMLLRYTAGEAQQHHGALQQEIAEVEQQVDSIEADGVGSMSHVCVVLFQRISEQRQEGTRPARGSGRACVDACGLRTGTLWAGCGDHRIRDRPDHALGCAGARHHCAAGRNTLAQSAT
jgi:hypothetical protein